MGFDRTNMHVRVRHRTGSMPRAEPVTGRDNEKDNHCHCDNNHNNNHNNNNNNDEKVFRIGSIALGFALEYGDTLF